MYLNVSFAWHAHTTYKCVIGCEYTITDYKISFNTLQYIWCVANKFGSAIKNIKIMILMKLEMQRCENH